MEKFEPQNQKAEEMPQLKFEKIDSPFSNVDNLQIYFDDLGVIGKYEKDTNEVTVDNSGIALNVDNIKKFTDYLDKNYIKYKREDLDSSRVNLTLDPIYFGIQNSEKMASGEDNSEQNG